MSRSHGEPILPHRSFVQWPIGFQGFPPSVWYHVFAARLGFACRLISEH